MGLSCFICEHTFDTWPGLTLHLKVFHSLRPTDRYICGQGGCLREFNLLKRLRSHIVGQHRELLEVHASVENDATNIDSNGLSCLQLPNISVLSDDDCDESKVETSLSVAEAELDCSSLAASFIAN
jgi:hypothetical protein